LVPIGPRAKEGQCPVCTLGGVRHSLVGGVGMAGFGMSVISRMTSHELPVTRAGPGVTNFQFRFSRKAKLAATHPDRSGHAAALGHASIRSRQEAVSAPPAENSLNISRKVGVDSPLKYPDQQAAGLRNFYDAIANLGVAGAWD